MIPAEVNSSADREVSHPAAVLRRLDWGLRKRAEGVLGGEYRSAFRGRGMEFDQVVRYEFGDDVRDIDWNVTARLGTPYRKKYIEEREVTVALVFQDSPSLCFGSGAVTRRDALMEMAGLVGLLASHNRDRLGIVYAGGGEHLLRHPVRGRGPILQSCAWLMGQQPTEGQGESQIPWDWVLRSLPRHTMVVWMGLFGDDPPPDLWTSLRRRFQLVGVRADDPWDETLPETEGFAVWDPATRESAWVTPSDKAQRIAHAAWRVARERSWTELFPSSRDRLVLRCGESVLDALASFLRGRMVRGGK